MMRRTVLSRGVGLAVLAGLLFGAPAAAVSYGRVGFTKMAVDDCADMFGTCEWKLSCRVGGGAETELFSAQKGQVAQDIAINKSFELKSLPAKVECSLFEDDGWFSESWNDAGKASLDLQVGGDYVLNIKGNEGTVAISLVADSFEMPDDVAGIAAPAPAKGKPAAARQFVGGYLRDPAGHGVVLGLPWDAFKAKVDAYAAQGVKVVKMEHWEAGGKRLWGAIFRSLEGKQELVPGLDYKPPFAQWKKLHDEGMRVADIEVYTEGNKFVFVGAFQEGVDDDMIWLGDLNPFIDEWSHLSGGGLRLVDLEILQASGKWQRVGAFRGGSGSYGIFNALTWPELQEKWKRKEDEGRTSITDMESYNDGGKRKWDLAMGGGQGKMTPLLDAAAFAKDWNDRLAQGFRLTAVETIP